MSLHTDALLVRQTAQHTRLMAEARKAHGLRMLDKVVMRLQKAKLHAGFSGWRATACAGKDAEAAREAALQQMNRVVQRLQKAMYARSWVKWVAGVFVRKSEKDAQRRAVVAMDRVVQRLQKISPIVGQLLLQRLQLWLPG